jgi:ABC-type bacteriocin/lantibiotic exporter with double-glycine peptidase domain
MRSWRELAKFFPSLGVSPRRVPFIAQTLPGECGSTCLAMLACAFGRPTDAAEVRGVAGASRFGLRAGEIVAAAQSLGFDARLVKLHEIDELRWLDRPVILHWRFNHFVVLERAAAGHATILDPALGRRRITRAELDASYTGVLIWLDAAPTRAAAPPRRPLWPFLKPLLAGMPGMGALLLLCLVAQALALAPALLSAELFGRLLPARDAGATALLALAALVVAGLAPFVELAKSHILLQLRSLLNLRLLTAMVERLLGARYQALRERGHGDLLTRLGAGDAIRNLLTGTGLGMVLDGAVSIGGWVVLILCSPICAAFTAVLTALAAIAAWRMNLRRREQLTVQFSAQGELQGIQMEILSGSETLRAGGMLAAVRARWLSRCADEVRASLTLGRTEGRFGAIVTALTQSGALLVLAFAGMLAVGGSLSLPAALLAYQLAALLLATAARLFSAIERVEFARFHIDLASEMLELPQEGGGSEQLVGIARGGAASLRCRDLSFHHAPHLPAALDGIDLDVPAGRLVAIVGASGSGKSTLLAMLVGLHVAAQGEVSIDGTTYCDANLAARRRRVILVPQSPYFFSASIRENLLMAAPAADAAALRRAAQLASIADDIEALPMAYETVLAEGGAGLSGGQLQRLALARALLAEPAVLLLDEATSALDALSEQRVLAALNTLECTRVVAAHRLSTVRAADLIVVLDAGRIVQRGSFAELSRSPGPFRRLFQRQFAGAENDDEALLA